MKLKGCGHVEEKRWTNWTLDVKYRAGKVEEQRRVMNGVMEDLQRVGVTEGCWMMEPADSLWRLLKD